MMKVHLQTKIGKFYSTTITFIQHIFIFRHFTLVLQFWHFLHSQNVSKNITPYGPDRSSTAPPLIRPPIDGQSRMCPISEWTAVCREWPSGTERILGYCQIRKSLKMGEVQEMVMKKNILRKQTIFQRKLISVVIFYEINNGNLLYVTIKFLLYNLEPYNISVTLLKIW